MLLFPICLRSVSEQEHKERGYPDVSGWTNSQYDHTPEVCSLEDHLLIGDTERYVVYSLCSSTVERDTVNILISVRFTLRAVYLSALA